MEDSWFGIENKTALVGAGCYSSSWGNETTSNSCKNSVYNDVRFYISGNFILHLTPQKYSTWRYLIYWLASAVYCYMMWQCVATDWVRFSFFSRATLSHYYNVGNGYVLFCFVFDTVLVRHLYTRWITMWQLLYLLGWHSVSYSIHMQTGNKSRRTSLCQNMGWRKLKARRF